MFRPGNAEPQDYLRSAVRRAAEGLRERPLGGPQFGPEPGHFRVVMLERGEVAALRFDRRAQLRDAGQVSLDRLGEVPERHGQARGTLAPALPPAMERGDDLAHPDRRD